MKLFSAKKKKREKCFDLYLLFSVVRFLYIFLIKDNPASFLGAIRLVHYLSQKHLFGKDQVVKIVVDAGTGTTAVGLALGALCLG